MAGSMSMLGDAPATWAALAVRSLRVAAVAFVVMQTKELVDAGRLDTLGTSVDGALIGAGVFLFHALFARPKGPAS